MTDLTDRMRTCAAYILAAEYDVPKEDDDEATTIRRRVTRHAADLLIEASNELVNTAECLERGAYDLRQGGYLRSASVLEEEAAKTIGPATWIAPGGPLPYAQGPAGAKARNPRACPKCESRGARTVRRQGNQLMLQCSVCGEQWQWTR